MTRTVHLEPGEDVIVYGEKLTATRINDAKTRIRVKDNRPVPDTEGPPDPVPSRLPTLTRAYIDSLPKSGKAYEGVTKYAASSVRPDLDNQDSPGSAAMLARGFVGDATGVAQDIAAARASLPPARVLSLGRESQPIALAAILTGNDAGPLIADILALKGLEDRGVGDGSLRKHAQVDPTNWGCHSRASIAWFAVAGAIPKEEAADNVRRYLTTGAGFVYKSDQQSWQPGPGLVCIGPKSDDPAKDGVIANDAYRGGPPPKLQGDGANYVWEGFQGTVSAAIALDMLGYDVWDWGDQAILRAGLWMHRMGVPASGDDLWIGHVLRRVYGSAWPHPLGASPVGPGKGWGFTDFLYSHGS